MIRWLDEFATPKRILWFGWLLFVVYSYPGYMSTDSVDQLLQARGVNEIHDWYPPVMAMMWRATDAVVSGPFPMLVIQSSAFLLGLAALLRHAMQPRRAAIVAAVVLLLPPVLTPMAVIWKDSQMAGFLIAGIACLLSQNRRWKVFGCVLLMLATAERYNAPAATLPIVLLLFTWGDAVRLRRYAIAALVWLAITLVAFGANKLFTERKAYAWHGSVALLDIVGMVKYAPKLDDSEVRERLAGLKIKPQERIQRRFGQVYNPRAWYWLANDETRVLEAPQTEEEREAVSNAWREMFFAYPRAYFGHRYHVFRELLGISDQDPGALWDGFTENPSQEALIKHQAKHSKIQFRWLHLFPSIHGSLLFRPWAYFLVGLLILPLCRRQRLAFVTIASGLLYELSLFVAAPSADYRYSHWMIVCTIIGTLLVFVQRWRLGAQRTGHSATVALRTST